MKTKKKRKTKSSNLTIPERKAKKRAEQDLERFKRQLRLWVGRTKLVWNGKPYSTESTYDFQLYPALTNMFVQMIQSYQEDQANQATLEQAEALRQLDAKEAE
jgi:hypothetical protein